MKKKALEDRVDTKSGLKHTAGPYDFYPTVYIINSELVINRQPEPDIELVKREWTIKDWLTYVFGDEKPSTTQEKFSYKAKIEIARIPKVRSFSIAEKNNNFWVEYE